MSERIGPAMTHLCRVVAANPAANQGVILAQLRTGRYAYQTLQRCKRAGLVTVEKVGRANMIRLTDKGRGYV